MNFGRLLVIFVDRRVFQQPSSLDFGGLRLRLSFGWSWSTSLASSHFSTCFHVIFCTCFRLIFPLALAFLFDLLRGSTCFVFRLASCFDLHCVDLSMNLRALAVNSLCGLIIFRMLGAYVDSSLDTLIPALWVHSLPLDFCVVKCILILHSGTSGRVIVYGDFVSGRVIPLLKGRCSADDLSLLIGIVARFRTRRLP